RRRCGRHRGPRGRGVRVARPVRRRGPARRGDPRAGEPDLPAPGRRWRGRAARVGLRPRRAPGALAALRRPRGWPARVPAHRHLPAHPVPGPGRLGGRRRPPDREDVLVGLTTHAPVEARPDATAWSRLRLAAWASLVANIAIVVTGGVVRLTGSGLGCPTWPRC